MEKVYKTSWILAYVLVAIALLGIAPVINGAVRDGIEQKYNLDVHSQDAKCGKKTGMRTMRNAIPIQRSKYLVLFQ